MDAREGRQRMKTRGNKLELVVRFLKEKRLKFT